MQTSNKLKNGVPDCVCWACPPILWKGLNTIITQSICCPILFSLLSFKAIDFPVFVLGATAKEGFRGKRLGGFGKPIRGRPPPLPKEEIDNTSPKWVRPQTVWWISRHVAESHLLAEQNDWIMLDRCRRICATLPVFARFIVLCVKGPTYNSLTGLSGTTKSQRADPATSWD